MSYPTLAAIAQMLRDEAAHWDSRARYRVSDPTTQLQESLRRIADELEKAGTP